jgi:ZIP family zinc transporter
VGIMDNLIFAFLLTLFAGLSTGIGSLIALFAKKTNTRFLSFSLGFSAGVMIYVSMVEIFVKSKTALVGVYGEKNGYILAVVGFFVGMISMAILDKIIPSENNPHEVHKVEEMNNENKEKKEKKLLRMGVFTALAVGIHNFPEGMATFISALNEPSLGIAIAFAIAIHNIPEGIAVSVPVYFATNDKKKAFRLSFLSGVSEPIGALLGYLVIYPLLSNYNDIVMGLIFAGVAGIMVFISLDELLPTAREYGEPHNAVYGLILGMLVMAISLLLFV